MIVHPSSIVYEVNTLHVTLLTGTFLSPTASKDVLQARRNSPDAWDDGRVELSTGYVSDIDLYRVKLSLTLGDAMMMMMKEGERRRGNENEDDSGCSDGDDSEKIIRSIGMFNDLLVQAAMAMKQNHHPNSCQSDRNSDSYSSSLEIPLFQSGNTVIDTGTLDDGLISLQEGFMSIVQEPGDLILIPPGCWHQVSCR
jgi:hypothetical protein